MSTLSDPNGEVKFSIAMYASIDGSVSSDRNQITGTWTQGVESVKLDLREKVYQREASAVIRAERGDSLRLPVPAIR